MNIQQFISQTASFALAGSFVVLVAHFLFKKSENPKIELPPSSKNDNEKSLLLNLRLQAHERMVIFVDRINPANLLLRLHTQGVSAEALQMLAITEIKNEFQHNITQQLYIDSLSWKIITNLKDDTIAMINNGVAHLPKNTAGIELSKMVLKHMSEIDSNPYELTIESIKQHIQRL